MTIDVGSEREAIGLAPLTRQHASGRFFDKPLVWRLLSIAVFALIWEVAGRVPVSYAFPTF